MAHHVVDFRGVVINEDLRALAENKKPSEEP